MLIPRQREARPNINTMNNFVAGAGCLVDTNAASKALAKDQFYRKV